jgi:hypothetical protein
MTYLNQKTLIPHPVRPTRRALAKQQTREKILAAGRELFMTRGYEGATIRDIARAASITFWRVACFCCSRTPIRPPSAMPRPRP